MSLPKDLKKAREWYVLSAAQTHPISQYALGHFHERGLAGFDADPKAAEVWYERAAAQGNKKAKAALQRIAAENR